MLEPILMGLIVLYFFTLEIFKGSPPPKSPEKQLGEALTRYLESGVKTKNKE